MQATPRAFGPAAAPPAARTPAPPATVNPTPPPSPPPHAGPSTREMSAQRAKIDRLETRIAVLEAQISSAAKPAPFWKTASASLPGAVLSSAVAVGGFFLVHQFSVMRQERDEFYKRVQDCVDVVNTAAQTASALWRKPGNTANEDGGVEDLQDAVTDIAQRLAFLKTLKPTYDVGTDFADFKRTATLNIEDTARLTDPQRANASRRAGRYLTGAMQTAFYRATRN